MSELSDKYYSKLPRTRTEVLIILDERLKSKSRWCTRQEIHEQLAFKVGISYVCLCKDCLMRELISAGKIIPVEEDIEVVEIG